MKKQKGTISILESIRNKMHKIEKGNNVASNPEHHSDGDFEYIDSSSKDIINSKKNANISNTSQLNITITSDTQNNSTNKDDDFDFLSIDKENEDIIAPVTAEGASAKLTSEPKSPEPGNLEPEAIKTNLETKADNSLDLEMETELQDNPTNNLPPVGNTGTGSDNTALELQKNILDSASKSMASDDLGDLDALEDEHQETKTNVAAPVVNETAKPTIEAHDDIDDLEEPADLEDDHNVAPTQENIATAIDDDLGDLDDLEEEVVEAKAESHEAATEDDLENLKDLEEKTTTANVEKPKETNIEDDLDLENLDDEIEDDLDLENLDDEEVDAKEETEEEDDEDDIDLNDLSDLEEEPKQAAPQQAPAVAEKNVVAEKNIAEKIEIKKEDADLNLDEDLGDIDLEEEKISAPTVNVTPINTPPTPQIVESKPTIQAEQTSEQIQNIPSQPLTPPSNPVNNNNMISEDVAKKTTDSIKELISSIPKKQQLLSSTAPAFKSGETIEDMVAALLSPRLEQWLNENLPVMVEKIVKEEIKKLIPNE
jgi:cell pole-organizing protein PopZ